MTSSLTPNRWVDDYHLDPKRGNSVFDDEKAAVSSLASLLPPHRSAIPAGALNQMIDELEQADQILASTALADAVAAHGDPRKIATARNELAAAAREIAAGHDAASIDHFKNAWVNAQQA